MFQKILLPLLMVIVLAAAFIIPKLAKPPEAEGAPARSSVLAAVKPAPAKMILPSPSTVAPAANDKLLDPFFQHLGASEHDKAQEYLNGIGQQLPASTLANLQTALTNAKKDRQELQSTLKETRELLQQIKEGSTAKAPAPEPKAPPPATVSIAFAHDSSVVAASDKTKLASVAEILAERVDLTAELRGYTDPSGDARYNAILAAARAEAVRDDLTAKNIGAERIRVLPFGESKAEANADPAASRRVDVIYR